MPASRVGYVPEAQGAVPPGPHVLYVRGTRTGLGRWVRTAYRGTPGGPVGAKVRQRLWTEYQATDGNGAAASGGLTLDMLDF